MPQFHAYGTTFELAGDDALCLHEACRRAHGLQWAPATSLGADVRYTFSTLPDDRTRFALLKDDVLLRCSLDRDEIVEAFEDHAKLDMAFRAHGVLFVHAGAIALNGRGILFPGRSGAGKTTLVHTLLEHGAEYYSDDFAVLTRDGRLQPFPLPLSIREGDQPGRTRVAPETQRWSIGRAAVPVGLIVNTHYEPGALWRPRPLAPGLSLLALMEHTVAATRPPADTMPILGRAVSSAAAFESPRAEAGDVARWCIGASNRQTKEDHS